MADFVSYAKANPGRINYGSSGVGTLSHLSMQIFRSMSGIDVVHIPYKTVGLAATDLISGEVRAMIVSLPTQVAAINAGRVRALGVTTLKRVAQLPDIPTLAESGLPGFETTVWAGVCAPSAVPKAVIARLNADIVRALSAPDVQRTLADQGIEAESSTPEQLGALQRSEIAKWAKAVKESGAKLD